MIALGNWARLVAIATTGAATWACAHDTGHASPTADGRGDMVSVLTAQGPHRTLGRDADLFGRFVGTWDANYSFIAADGSVRRKRGEVLFGWILDGHALEDIFLTYPDSTGDERKMVAGIRWVNPKTGRWTLAFVAPTFGVVQKMEGGAEGDRIVLRGRDSTGTLLRWALHDTRH